MGFRFNLFAPVDVSSLVFFRIYFGAMMLWEIGALYARGLITSLYVAPTFHFTYHGFSWIRPWPDDGMYVHFAVLALLSLFVLVGFLYRLSAILLAIGFTHVFLIEKAVYLNHYYLMCLLCFTLAVVPAHRAFSIDAWLRPSLRSQLVPAWCVGLLRFHVALPYIFGGLAKLDGDWLRGQPMQMWLSISVWRVLLGDLAQERWFALLFSWGGLIFDLAVVPLLRWHRTRPFAFAAAVVFHLLNAFMLDIGIFPWLMIGATTIFFEPDWPRRLLASNAALWAPPKAAPTPGSTASPSRAENIVAWLLLAYTLVHLVLPLRYLLYPGHVHWTEQGALFSWRMMLRAKVNAVGFVLTDVATGETRPLDPRRLLKPPQVESMGYDPEMMREFANFLREEYARAGRNIEVRVLALCSLNGRKPQLLVKPMVDLSRQPRTLLPQSYIVPLTESFRDEPWTVPVAEWSRHLLGTP